MLEEIILIRKMNEIILRGRILAFTCFTGRVKELHRVSKPCSSRSVYSTQCLKISVYQVLHFTGTFFRVELYPEERDCLGQTSKAVIQGA